MNKIDKTNRIITFMLFIFYCSQLIFMEKYFYRKFYIYKVIERGMKTHLPSDFPHLNFF